MTAGIKRMLKAEAKRQSITPRVTPTGEEIYTQDQRVKLTGALFPGIKTSPESFFRKYAARQPSASLTMNALSKNTYRECMFDDDVTGFICPQNWTQLISKETNETYCFKKMGSTEHSKNPCIDEGASRIQFNRRDRGFDDILKKFLGKS